MDVRRAEVKRVTWSGAFVSKTLLTFHGAILVSIVMVMLLMPAGGE